MNKTYKSGAFCLPNGGCTFTVWAPEKKNIALKIVHPEEQRHEMVKGADGYFSITLLQLFAGTQYYYEIDSTQHADPASFCQPEGVGGPSQVINLEVFKWSDSNWHGLPFKSLVLYELHVGTFTNEGTFDAVISRLPELAATGINALQLMPVSQFPGERNWGYDGVFPYAVQNSYGGTDGLMRLIDASHRQGIAVFLDVVYNHLGPEGNCLPAFGPYFTDYYRTPWGSAFNLDREYSDGVKDFFLDNIEFWFRHFHIDGLRLDAIHFMFDNSACTFWDLAHTRVKELEQQLGRPLYIIAESDENTPKVTASPAAGGKGMDAQWLHDFHHALYVLLYPEGKKEYVDFGSMEQLAKAHTDSFVHSGEYVQFRKRRHGISSAGVPGNEFIVFNNNHDQVGNAKGGKRLSNLVDFERLKLAAAVLLLSPYIPMLMMGDEYGENAPFLYFVNHSSKQLLRNIRKGRKKDFEAKSSNNPNDFPNPDDIKTFEKSRLCWEKREQEPYQLLLQWHTELIRLRQGNPLLRNLEKNYLRANIAGKSVLEIHRSNAYSNEHLLCIYNLCEKAVSYTLPAHHPVWSKILYSEDAQWRQHARHRKHEMPKTMHAGAEIYLRPWSVLVLG